MKRKTRMKRTMTRIRKRTMKKIRTMIRKKRMSKKEQEGESDVADAKSENDTEHTVASTFNECCCSCNISSNTNHECHVA